MFTISTKDLKAQFDLTWAPLIHEDKKVYIWEYPSIKVGVERPVIYRHVIEISGVLHTVYVGEGCSLNGPRKASLVYQYSHGGHGSTRVKIRQFFMGRSNGWTELLSCPQIDLHSDSDRLALESLLEGLFYFENRNSPEYSRQGLVYLNGRLEV